MAQQNADGYWEHLGAQKERLIPLREIIDGSRGPLVRAVEGAERFLAHPGFFAALLGSHALWLILNLPIFPWTPWDPFPFTFLSMVASVEAPFFALLILMHQRRQRQIAELREEVELQFSLHLERQTSELIRAIDRVEDAIGIKEGDPSIRERREAMATPLDPERVLDTIRQRIEEDDAEDQPGSSRA